MVFPKKTKMRNAQGFSRFQVNCRNQAWLLKNSISLQTTKIGA